MTISRQIARKIVRSEAFLNQVEAIVDEQIRRALQESAGGSSVYIPKGVGRDEKNERNRMLLSKFTGDNFAQLSAEFNLSPRQVRRIIRECAIKK